MMMQRARGRFVVTLAIAASLIGGASGTAAQAQEDDEIIRFTWGSTGEPSSLNPMSGYLAVDFYFWTASYHLPLDFDENLQVEDGLVTDVQVSEDNMEFTYTVRDDLVWSDGTPLTADDVVFTLNLYKFNHAYLPQGYLKLIDGEVEKVDDTTIRFRTKQPTGLYNGEYPYMYTYILPKHVFEGIEKPKQFENVPNVGSGPFIITEYAVGEFVKMERNPEWTGQEPIVDELVYRIFRNEDALAEALKAGEVDLAYFSAANIYNSLQNEPNIESLVGTIPSFSEIGMNTGSAFQPPEGAFEPHGDGHEALTDVRVRRAIRMAIDSQRLVDSVLLGYGAPGDTVVPPVSLAGARWEPTGDELIAWDIEGANQLLDEAGYLDTDGDGVREMPGGGDSLDFRYYVRTSEQTSVDAAPFVSEWLEQIGIRTDVQAVTSGRLGDIINAGTYDLFSWGWIPDPDPDAILQVFTCDERPPDGSSYGNNDPYYCNPEYDRLYEEQRATIDPTERWEIVHEMQRIFYEDSAYAVMWYEPIFQAYRADRFTGFNPQPAPNGDLLEGYGGPSDVWLTLRPAGMALPGEEGDGTGGGDGVVAGGDTSATTRGIPAGVWIAIAAGLVLVIAVFVLRRRRSTDEEA
jgi:peptide/nickel transport system substrate-binding protein